MPDTKFMTAGLVSSCLLSLVELILDGSAKGWRSLTGKIEIMISMHTDTTQTLPHLGRSLYWFARISIAARAVCFGENLSMPPPALTCARSDMPSGNALPSGVEEDIALLAMHLESWAQLQSQAICWINDSEELYLKENRTETNINGRPLFRKEYSNLPFEHIMRGMEIVCCASQLQRAIIATVLSYTNSPLSSVEPSILSLLPYYQWSLAGLSRQFVHPAWTSLGCCLPVMPDDLIYQQAMQAFAYAEGSLHNSADFEGLLYVPIMNIVGLEMKTAQERTRALDFLTSLKAKGFAVAGKVEQDLKKAWIGQA
ncbi:hypothetical protein ASPBRDRAFT_35218 [Aspergillus brasiliensis CBS 101740]|uniref:Transcription factor domain-containing protein n=1 Tax=Aspergillus brasiliensis (strain CBS 101740 / IMI 381727 / IBT 21946) TaxID=767769 RepID=A0A1L9U475_ASPBC|nr:hypothetical protein ASPBRDRAFT_35218 [Aspergillus brasiliensis CBS 101740]